jgi:photosystem II stability/assembly factor-like uncharacterized protein
MAITASIRSFATFVAFGASLHCAAATFVDPVDEPSASSALAARMPLLAAARAGNRSVAAGLRGHIVVSDDEGNTWKQAQVPVSVDLLGLSFPTAKTGWAVGQGGVVLKTQDGGASWVRQLGGKQAAEIAVKHYKALPAPTVEEAKALKQAEALVAQGAAQPFLDVYFQNETTGFVVGTFNTIYRTVDGGATWVPWMDRTGNADESHFYAVRGQGGRVFLTGEQGKVWRLQADQERFAAVPTPYKGTLFGLVVGENATVLAFGMRGTLYRSADDGAAWTKVELNTAAGITAGTVMADGRISLVSQGGGVLLSQDQGKTFKTTKLDKPMPYYGVAPGGKSGLVLVGALGAVGATLP